MPELHGTSSFERGARAHPSLVEYATRHARSLGVELLTETAVAGATPNEVFLSNGMHVPTRTIVSAVGTRAQPILDGLDLPRDDHGRIVTDRFLRVEGRGRLGRRRLRRGPAPARRHLPAGRPLRAQARHADRRATSSAAWPARRPSRSPTPRSRPASRSAAAPPSARCSASPLRGKLGWLLWRAILIYYVPTWDRRLRLLADWLIWPAVGRDVVELDHAPRSEFDVRHQAFGAGEVLARAERPVREVHVILEGDVVLRHEGEVLEVLHPGGHFGRKVLELRGADEARALTHVRTLALREDQANQLQDVLASTGRLAARTGSFPTLDLGD